MNAILLAALLLPQTPVPAPKPHAVRPQAQARSLAGNLHAGRIRPEKVEFLTEDGIKIHALYVPAGANEGDRQPLSDVPAVVLLHMYRSDKSSWKPIFAPFAQRGMALLAIDMRGHGESVVGPNGEDLRKLALSRDPKLFRDMHLDAAAAVKWLTDRGHDEKRIGLLGASVGCSVAIDAAHRDPGLRVVGVLTPGTEYLGIPTMKHVQDWGDRALLLASSEEEAPRGAEPIQKYLSKQEGSRVTFWRFPQHGIHGTRMFGQVEGIETRLANWFAEHLGGRAVPVPAAARKEARPHKLEQKAGTKSGKP